MLHSKANYVVFIVQFVYILDINLQPSIYHYLIYRIYHSVPIKVRKEKYSP